MIETKTYLEIIDMEDRLIHNYQKAIEGGKLDTDTRRQFIDAIRYFQKGKRWVSLDDLKDYFQKVALADFFYCGDTEGCKHEVDPFTLNKIQKDIFGSVDEQDKKDDKVKR